MDRSLLQLPVQDPVLIFGIAMTAILLAPLLFTRLRMPGVIGIIVVGVIIGPNGLNILERSESIVLLGTVGLLYIMFTAGLDIDMNQFLRNKYHSLVFGTLTFVIPMVLGTALFLWMGFGWTAAILIASMFASHTLVAYPVVKRLGIARDPAVTTAVGGTILTDTAALLVLAVVARSAQGELTAEFWTQLTIFFLAYMAVVIVVFPILGRWFFRRIHDQAAQFAFVLAVVFLAAWTARAIGTEPIIGAFFAGLALNRLIPDTSPLMTRIQFFGDAFIIPFFLLFIGMLVDPAVLAGSATAWIVMGAMLATNVVSKWIASTATRRFFGYSSAQGWVIFGLSTTEAAATLAATLVGLDLGIIGDEVLNGVIMMIFVTCILGPWVVGHFGRAVARQQEERPVRRDEAPQRVLVPLASPATAEALLDLAFMLRESPEVPVFPLTVVPTGTNAQVAESEAMLSHAVVHAASADVPVTPLTRVDLNIAGGIIRAIQEKRVTDVVIGWNGARSTGERIFGSVLDHLLRHTVQDVLVAKIEKPINTITRIVLVVPPHLERDGSFSRVIARVKTLAVGAGADLFLVTVAGHTKLVKRVVERAKPACKTVYHEMRDWGALLPTLRIAVSGDDLLMVLGARVGRPSWGADVNRLPQVLTDEFPEVNFVTAYGADPEEDPEVEQFLQMVVEDSEADQG